MDGEGYAAVGRPTRWNPNVSTVAFKFRTFSSDALLMYLATDDMVGIQCKKPLISGLGFYEPFVTIVRVLHKFDKSFFKTDV